MMDDAKRRDVHTDRIGSPDQKPKPATSFTRAKNNAVLYELPFNNDQDFDDAKQGLICQRDSMVIMGGDPPRVVWDLDAYAFAQQGISAPDTVNPSLWRQLQLLTINGLFKVTSIIDQAHGNVEHGIYQLRGFDLSNMTIIESHTGIIVIDPLISAETARAALDLYYTGRNTDRSQRPVRAVIYTHSHIDHYGGVRGVIPDDAQAKDIQIWAPEGFLEHAVDENVIAGNAMSRRSIYMYGALLPKDAQGQVSTGLGLTNSRGTTTLIPPTNTVSKTYQSPSDRVFIDGVVFHFQITPGTEAPAEMNFFLPQFKALCMAENLSANLHNILTLRGAEVRDALAWSRFLNESLDMFGDQMEVIFTVHHWPKWGNDNARDYMIKQRDLYKFIHDQAVRLLNEGYTPIEIAEQIKLPQSLAQVWFNRSYYGTVNHNVKAVYQKYMGWFDGNPANLHSLPPEQAGAKYVAYMGGADAVLKQARISFDNGEYRWVAQVVNHVVFADPSNLEARYLQADALEQLGYQAESGPWRNFYLMGARELRAIDPRGRDGGPASPDTPAGTIRKGRSGSVSPDAVTYMTLDMIFDFMAVHLNGPKAEGMQLIFNLVIEDRHGNQDTPCVLEVTNSVLQYFAGRQSPDANATAKLFRETLNAIVLGETTFTQAIQSGDISVIAGDPHALETLDTLFDSFDLWFHIVTP